MTHTAPSGVDYPGRTLGIVGLVLSFFVTIVGSIVSFVAWRRSRAAGYRNTPATVGMSIGLVALAFWVLVVAILTPYVGVAGGS